ncbi:MAG: metal-dependent phosphohydrolase [Pseudomonadota bacterium]
MFNPVAITIDKFAELLSANYCRIYAHTFPNFGPTLTAIARLSVERIAGSDALYHDYMHTICVTEVGQEILRGRMMIDTVAPLDWVHFTAATLLHDVGYLRGICPGDRDGHYIVDAAGNTVQAPLGSTDAFLAPWHVERGKIFVRHRLADIPHIDVERICRAIELTRFPVPDDGDHAETDTEAGLVRAADLIGQLADPNYHRKQAALFYEFMETGVDSKLECRNAGELADTYPKFFWSKVEPYIGAALAHLERTIEGRDWIANLYAHVFIEEKMRRRLGPERAPNSTVASEPAATTHKLNEKN